MSGGLAKGHTPTIRLLRSGMSVKILYLINELNILRPKDSGMEERIARRSVSLGEGFGDKINP